MKLQTALERYQQELTEADERLLKVLLANKAEAAFLSAAELSKRAGVHQASAVRLAQKLGYRGYPELRAALQAEFVAPAERVRNRLASLSGEVLPALVESETALLAELTHHVRQADLDAAARTLIGARRVFLFARGHATALLEWAERRLRRSGFETVPLKSEGRDLAEGVLGLGEGDALLAFAFHRTPPGLRALLEHAHEVGAPSILVSNALGPLLRPRPGLLLVAPRGEGEAFATLTVPFVVLNALVLAVARLDEGRSLGSLERLSKLLERFEEREK